ncbi:Importin subunit alpha-1b [Phytophthora citrophthora]|uniref:Importin subunit alpha-1b n=1 Tax=Phytophthora citrophthora TaxID=4793 RepID=A0AAD9LM58_9STRA|nr:Importin subunit alpha-1b [Phytophthora citrophthora]
MTRVLRRVAASARRWGALTPASATTTRVYTALATSWRPVRTHKLQLPVAAARSLSTSSSNIFELAQALKAKETSTDDRVTAINGLNLSTSLDKTVKERHALEIVDSDALEALLSLLQDSDTIASSDLLVPSFLALIRLSVEPLLAQELLRLKAPTILTPFLTQTDPRLQAAASLTLGNLALAPTAGDALSSPTVVKAVLSVLESPHEAIKRAACTCVGNIASTAPGRRQVMEQGGLLRMAGLLEDDYSDALRSASAFALGNILSGRDIDAQDTLRESGALPALVLLLSPVFAEDVNSSAAWAVHHGVHLNAASQSLVAEAGGLAMLVQHLVNGVLESLQTNALLALESAAVSNEENLDWLRDNGAIDVLERVQQTDGDALNTNAKQALKSLLDQLK